MRIGHKVGVGVAVLGSLLLAVSGAVPALARSGPSAGLFHPRVVRVGITNATSTAFAGWVFQPSVPATGMSVKFKVPTPTCTSTTSAIAPLASMYTGSSSAPNTNAAGIALECVSGSPVGAAVVIVDGVQTVGTQTLTVGDLMKASVFTSATKTTATVSDLTTGHTFKLTKSGAGAASFQEQIGDFAVSSSGTQLPILNFGKVAFSAGAVGGKPLGSVTPNEAVNMQTSTGVLQVATGALTGTKLNAFHTIWKHS